MFRQIMSDTPLTNEVADLYFNNIVGNSYNNDMSFVATARALIAPRMKEGDSLTIVFGASNYSKSRLESESRTRNIDSVNRGGENTVYIHDFKSPREEDNDAWMDYIEEHLTKAYPEYKKLDKITLFFKKVFRVTCFVCPEKKSVLLYTTKLRVSYMHYLQCGMLAFLPWYFNKEEGISEQEMELIESLRMKSSQKYLECLQIFASKYDFRATYIQSKLKGFETRFEKQVLADEKMRWENLMSEIKTLNERINDRLKSKAHTEAKILGLETKIANGEGENEIMDYFIANKRLNLIDCNDRYIRFTVKDYLEYWDEDMAESMINSKRSYMYRYVKDMTKEEAEKMYRAVFLDEEIKIKFCGCYTLEFGGNVSTPRNWHFGEEYKDAMPNVHTDRYECLGNYQRIINEFLSNNDYLSAIEQCVASCKSLNFGDSTVMDSFMMELFEQGDGRNNRCFELPTGEIVDPKGVVKYLNEKEAKDEQAD